MGVHTSKPYVVHVVHACVNVFHASVSTYVHIYICECMHCGSSLTAVSVVRVAAAEILPYLLQDISVKGVFSDSCSVCNAVSLTCMFSPFTT